MILAEDLKNQIFADENFHILYFEAEMKSAKVFFHLEKNHCDIRKDDHLTLLRYADILSHSADASARNKAYKIISLLVDEFGRTNEFAFFASAVLSKVGNFPALKFLQSHNELDVLLPWEREVEKSLKEVTQKTADGKHTLTDTQFEIRTKIEEFDYFSFSGPTSVGKSFIIKEFIHSLLNESHLDNGGIVILVPTKALIGQVANDLRRNIKREGLNIATHPTLTRYAQSKFRHHIFVFTPERLLSYVSSQKFKIKYLFVDEAQKIIDINDSRSSLYYHAIYETFKVFAVKVIFASPNIPNPEIFLALFEKNQRGTLTVRESTVSQSRYYIDLCDDSMHFFSDVKDGPIAMGACEVSTFNDVVKKYGGKTKSIIYCNGVSDTVERAKNLAGSLGEVDDKEISELIDFVAEFVHKDYFLLKCLRSGVAFHHGRMPQKIREKVEAIFERKNSPIQYIFCTSTLLEGVNLPAKNIFILSDKHGLSNFTKINFENLVGRSGRLTKDFYGNVICVRDRDGRWKDVKFLLQKADLVPAESFLLNENRSRKKETSNIKKILDGDKVTQSLSVGMKENLKNYATITLLHHIEKDGSVLKTRFLEKEESASLVLRKSQKNNHISPEILKTCSSIKLDYQNSTLSHIKNSGENALFTLDLEDKDSLVNVLETLYDLYNWGEEESIGRDPIIPPGLERAGYGKAHLRYWGMLLRNWIKLEPLNRLIEFSIAYHYKKGEIWIRYNGIESSEKFIGSPTQINAIIEKIMNDIETGLRFKMSKYFLNYYLILKNERGEENAGQDFSELIEYGTDDRQIIELQNFGFSRTCANYLKEGHSKCFKYDSKDELLDIDEIKLMKELDKKDEFIEEIKEVLGINN